MNTAYGNSTNASWRLIENSVTASAHVVDLIEEKERIEKELDKYSINEENINILANDVNFIAAVKKSRKEYLKNPAAFPTLSEKYKKFTK